MKARFPGACGCGCGRRFAAGAELVRQDGGGWALASCRAATAAPPRAAPNSGPEASPAEVVEILLRARAVAERVERETAARLAAAARARAGAGAPAGAEG